MFSEHMFLDTVELVISVPPGTESVRYPFDRRKYWKYEYGSGYSVYVFTQKRKIEQVSHEYLPTIKYRKRRLPYSDIERCELLVEFSIPKLLFGNNFMDVSKSELDTLHEKLLHIINVEYQFRNVDMSMLKEAKIKRMDCGSQVLFPDLATHDRALKRIASAGLDPRIDIERPQYSERSTGLNINCNAWQFVFYNKTEELKRYATSRRKAKFETANDIMLDNGFGEIIRTTDGVFMRFEIRFNGQDKVEYALNRIEESIESPFTLTKAIDRSIPQKVLRHYWQQILNNLPRHDIVALTDEEALNIAAQQSNTFGGRAKIFTRLKIECMDQGKARQILTQGKSRSAWTSLRKKLDSVPKLSNQPDPIQAITDKIFNLASEHPPKPMRQSALAVAVVVGFAISITIIKCTKSLHFFRWVGGLRWLWQFSVRAPPNCLIAHLGVIPNNTRDNHF